MLKLYRLVFVGLTSPDGEALLVAPLAAAFDACLERASSEREPRGYLSLLRVFFKACQASREPLKALYQECVPRLAPALSSFLAMIHGPNSTPLRPLLVELCLTLPAQLSSLLPLLPRLMRPLVLALQGPGEELVMTGLRTLECWVDSLNPEFLEPAMADVVSEVMPALWALLRPSGYPMKPPALVAMTLLGKLGAFAFGVFCVFVFCLFLVVFVFSQSAALAFCRPLDPFAQPPKPNNTKQN